MMADQNADRAGIAGFGDDEEPDHIPLPSAEQRSAARAGGERLGFRSEISPARREKPAPVVREAVFTANFHIRTTPEDRQRFDDFAYRHRMKKGEAMTLLIDLAEEAEAARKAAKD